MQATDNLRTIAALTVAGSTSYGPATIGAYADAIVARNPQVYDWTAPPVGMRLTLPA